MSAIADCESWKLLENLCFLYSMYGMYGMLSEEQQNWVTVSALYVLLYDEEFSC